MNGSFHEQAEIFCSFSQNENNENPSLDDLPQEVKDFFSDNYADYNFKIKKQTFCDDTEVYLLSGEGETETLKVLL